MAECRLESPRRRRKPSVNTLRIEDLSHTNMDIVAELKVWKKIEEQRETGIQQSAISACVGGQIAIHRETKENQKWQFPKQNYKKFVPVVVSCLCPFREMLVFVWACSWVSSWVTRWDDSGIAIDEETSRWQEKQNSKQKDKLDLQAPPPLFFTQLHDRGLSRSPHSWVHANFSFIHWTPRQGITEILTHRRLL